MCCESMPPLHRGSGLSFCVTAGAMLFNGLEVRLNSNKDVSENSAVRYGSENRHGKIGFQGNIWKVEGQTFADVLTKIDVN